LFEVERKAVAARAAPAVDEHRLGAQVRDERRSQVPAVAHGPEIAQRPIEQFDEAVGNLAAAVETLVNKQAGFPDLRAPHAHELVLAILAGIGHIDVAELSAAELLDAAPVLLDPGQVAQPFLAAQGVNQDLAGAGQDRLVIDRQQYRLVPQPLKSRPGVLPNIQRLAVDGEQVVALMHVGDRGRQQRRAHFTVPVRRPEDALDAIGAVFEREIAPQVAHAHRAAGLEVAAAAIRMRRVQLCDKFSEHVVDIPARDGVVEQPPIALVHGVPIHPMHARVVKVIALDAPGVGEDLPPLSDRINHRLEPARLELLIQLLPLLGLEDGVVAAFAHQQLLPPGGQLEEIRILDHDLLFALLQVVEGDGLLFLARAHARTAVKEQLAGDRCKGAKAPGLGRQNHHTLLKARHRNFHRLGLLLLLLAVLAWLLLRVIVLLVFGRGVLGVVARRERREHIRTQRHRGQHGRIGINPSLIHLAVAGGESAARAEEQVFAVGIEDRRFVIIEPRGDLMQRVGFAIVKGDARVAVVQVLRPSQPAAVRRPTHSELA